MRCAYEDILGEHNMIYSIFPFIIQIVKSFIEIVNIYSITDV